MTRKIYREGLVVLIVDDDPTLLLSYARSLRVKSWSVLTALNPKSARPLVSGADIVLSDWSMPFGGGRDMVNQCWDIQKPIVIASADTFEIPPMLKPVSKIDGIDAIDKALFDEYHRYHGLTENPQA